MQEDLEDNAASTPLAASEHPAADQEGCLGLAEAFEYRRFRRHFVVLMHKNALLKRRAILSTFCELFMANAAISLLVLARVLAKDAKIPPVPPQLHTDSAMPVRLPECAEYLAEECHVNPIGNLSEVCMEGITYGCHRPDKEGVPAVWVRGHCGGTFDVGPQFLPVNCQGGDATFFKGDKHICYGETKADAAKGFVDVNIGPSCWLDRMERVPTVVGQSIRHCVPVPVNKRVTCKRNSGNKGHRVNLDYVAAGDHFDVQTKFSDTGKQMVCATRLDDDGCWAVNLTVRCVQGNGAVEDSSASDSLPVGGSRGMLNGLLGLVDRSGMRRYDAGFAVSPPSVAGPLRRWLRRQGHPWAGNVRAFNSSEAIQAHVTGAGYPNREKAKNRTSLLCGAAIFDTELTADKVEYTLRFNTTLFANEGQPQLIRALKAMGSIRTDGLVDSKEHKKQGGNFDVMGMTWYTQSGFLAMQRSLDEFLSERFLEAARGSEGDYSYDYDTAVEEIPVRRLQGKGRMTDLSRISDVADSVLGGDGRFHIVAPFPTEGYSINVFMMLMPQMLATFLLISLTYSMHRMITAVVSEREKRLRDGMRMMGMHPSAFHVSWFVTYMIVGSIVSLSVTMLLSQGGVLPKSNPLVLFLWLFLFAAAGTSYALAIAALFTKAKTAASVGSVVFYSSSYLLLLVKARTTPALQFLVGLVPTSCFEMGAQIIADTESHGEGISFQNLTTPHVHFGSVANCCMMLLFDSILYYALFLYLDQVMPRETGLQKPWYFPVLPSTWAPLIALLRKKGGAREIPLTAMADVRASSQAECSALIERDLGIAASAFARAGETVELRGLTKVYSGGLKAVDNLDLVMYPGEVFALLGHNGAGKTTTFAMLCGLMPPTHGQCLIFGHDLARQPEEVQRLLGVCPQHDVLWEELSCREHLRLFAGFKGVPRERVEREVISTLQYTGLHSAEHTLAGHLSGGMKRRLSLGIAFLGGSRVVVLDEPTSGLDPFARRAVWDLLRSTKQNRVIVLSTHYMDEADILGDRIAILREGRLQCCGSPQFLKRAYSCGYNITFVKREGCDTDAIQEAICCHMPELSSEVVVFSDSGKELVIQCPFAASSHFSSVLGSIEEHKEKLGVESYGISVTTLEEVFLKVASGDQVHSSSGRSGSKPQASSASSAAMSKSRSNSSSGKESQSPNVAYERMEDIDIEMSEGGEQAGALGASPKTGATSPCRRIVAPGLLGEVARFGFHLRALTRKRVKYGLRDRKTLACQLLLPTGTLVFCMWMMSHYLFHTNPPLLLDARGYNTDCAAQPQNRVDFTYLPSIHVDEVTSMLEPGKQFWNGELFSHTPAKAEDDDSMADSLLTSALPHAVRTARSFAKDLANNRDPDVIFDDLATAVMPGLLAGLQKIAPKNTGDGQSEDGRSREMGYQARRLGARNMSDVSESNVKRRVLALLSELFVEFWSYASVASQVFPDAADVAKSSWAAVVEENKTRRLQFGRSKMMMSSNRFDEGIEGDPVHVSFSGQGTPAGLGCMSGTKIEQALWRQLDQDHLGRVDEETFVRIAWEMIDKTPARKIRRDQANEMILEEGIHMVFETLDEDKDGMLTASEFCRFGIGFNQMAAHYMQVGAHFSTQLLKAPPAQCTRYGAYYVLHAPKKNDTELRSNSDAVIFVNTSSSHAAPVFQSVLTNARLARLGAKQEVAVKVHPFPQTQDEVASLEQFAVFLLSIYITFSLSFIPAGITNFVVRERASGARQLQALSGASTTVYWASNFIYDCVLYIVPAVGVVLALKQFGFNMLLKGECGAALVCVLAAFGPAVIGFTYLISFLFKDHSKAASSVLTFCLAGAGILSAILFVLVFFNYDPSAQYPSACDTPTEDHPEGTCKSPRVRMAEKILGPLFRLVPTVCVYQALFSIALVADLHEWIPKDALEVLEHAGSNSPLPKVSFSVWAWEWAGEPLHFLVAEGIVYFFLAVAIDTCMHSPWLQRKLDRTVFLKQLFERISVALQFLKGQFSPTPSNVDAERLVGGSELPERLMEGPSRWEDDDRVEAEHERLKFLAPEDAALHVLTLVKTYKAWLALRQGEKRAVKTLSFAVHASEVFGLLGHNGAGKTTALKCIIGEHCCTEGSVHIGGSNMATDTAAARGKLGYCPQHDALLEMLTVRDHLELFTALKDLPASITDSALVAFNLSKMEHRRADVLSGGNRRKLSAAIALMGGPRLAVLDEPSCGLDPAARRALWAAVQHAVRCGNRTYSRALDVVGRSPAGSMSDPAATAVLLTTHSMEEAEALSTRLGIMAEGQMVAIGTAQQIKQRHSGAHELSLNLNPTSEDVLPAVLSRLGFDAQYAKEDATLAYPLIGPLLDASHSKKGAYADTRCSVRAQLESHGRVSALVFAEWWLQQEQGEEVERVLRGAFGDGLERCENFGSYWRFRMPRGSIHLPQIFRTLEEQKEPLNIAEYTLTQATLEQIFNGVAEEAATAREEQYAAASGAAASIAAAQPA
eukprot:TRINITY_DN3330_c0_g1_i1.p1 TRINITY_DN3330_c0_g1~~TRINITY_DN3330_c0_g1_i1.p1  ORF type:complete len:2490 (-),score=538.21 TRINITY_DN3330_c0_g1_i1:116-7585(-)